MVSNKHVHPVVRCRHRGRTIVSGGVCRYQSTPRYLKELVLCSYYVLLGWVLSLGLLNTAQCYFRYNLDYKIISNAKERLFSGNIRTMQCMYFVRSLGHTSRMIYPIQCMCFVRSLGHTCRMIYPIQCMCFVSSLGHTRWSSIWSCCDAAGMNPMAAIGR